MRKSLTLLLSLMMMIWIAIPASAATTAGAFGVVLDAAGHPVSGAEIEVYQLGAGLTATLTTGADGAFRLERPVDGARSGSCASGRTGSGRRRADGSTWP